MLGPQPQGQCCLPLVRSPSDGLLHLYNISFPFFQTLQSLQCKGATYTSPRRKRFFATKSNSFNANHLPFVCYMCVSGIALPKHWDPMPQSDKTVHLVQLAPGSPEYQDVVRKVQSSSGGINVQKIERVQNPHLYQSYFVRKQKMDQDNPRGNNERQLFHGTQHNNIKAINTQGFNRSFCGVHGRHLSFNQMLREGSIEFEVKDRNAYSKYMLHVTQNKPGQAINLIEGTAGTSYLFFLKRKEQHKIVFGPNKQYA